MTQDSSKAAYRYEIYDLVALIPKGRVTTYGLLASFLQLPSPRMAGYALRHIPEDIQIPAHRVVSAHGILTGRAYFKSESMATKLMAEGVSIKGIRIQKFNEILWDPYAEII